MVTRGELCGSSGVQQLGGVGICALDPQKNLESHGARGRNGHRSLLSQMVARLKAVTIDEFPRCHTPLAFELDLDQFQGRARGATDQQTRSLDCNLSGRQLHRGWRGLGAMHLQCSTFESRERSGPRLKTTQAIEKISGGASEIHAAVFFFQNRGKRGLRMILGSRVNLPGLEPEESLNHQIRADRRQLRAQGLGRIVRVQSQIRAAGVCRRYRARRQCASS